MKSYIVSEEELKDLTNSKELYDANYPGNVVQDFLADKKPIEEIASGEVINDRLYHRGAIAGYLELQELINERFDGKSIKIYIQEESK